MIKQANFTNELALLGFLRQQPRHGYAIHQALSESTALGAVWQIKISKLYALLAKLVTAGYLTTTTEPQANKPPRKIFHLTEEGKIAFLSWVEQPVENGRSLRIDFLLKLYFARREAHAVAVRLLTAQRTQCQEWLKAEQVYVDVEQENGRRYSQLVHQFRLGQIEAMLSWLDQCAEVLAHEA